jgi:hypothetical protein
MLPDTNGAAVTDAKNDPRLVDAFTMMWGAFPDPMILVHRDRTVLARNDAAAATGWLEVGQHCFDANATANGHACKGCQANAALRQGSAIACDGELLGKRIRGYWLPVKGATDVYVHGYSSLDPAPLAVVA